MAKKAKLIGSVSAIFQTKDVHKEVEEFFGEKFMEFERETDLTKHWGEECVLSMKDGNLTIEVDGVFISWPLSRVRTI